MTQPISIDVISDVICPWCFLGKRRLDKAIAQLDGIPVTIRWRPFLLDPTIPAGGMPRRQYLESKFGADRLATLHDPLVKAGAEDGIAYAFDKITVTPNSLNAHRLIRWAHAANRQHDMAERLFALYWLECQDIGDPAVLLKAAVDVGLDGAIVADLFRSEADLDAVIAEIHHAGAIGVTGVPTYIIGNRYALVGAQPPAVLQEAITRVSQEPAPQDS